jgi:hypothetical protein
MCKGRNKDTANGFSSPQEQGETEILPIVPSEQDLEVYTLTEKLEALFFADLRLPESMIKLYEQSLPG